MSVLSCLLIASINRVLISPGRGECCAVRIGVLPDHSASYPVNKQVFAEYFVLVFSWEGVNDSLNAFCCKKYLSAETMTDLRLLPRKAGFNRSLLQGLSVFHVSCMQQPGHHLCFLGPDLQWGLQRGEPPSRCWWKREAPLGGGILSYVL